MPYIEILEILLKFCGENKSSHGDVAIGRKGVKFPISPILFLSSCAFMLILTLCLCFYCLSGQQSEIFIVQGNMLLYCAYDNKHTLDNRYFLTEETPLQDDRRVHHDVEEDGVKLTGQVVVLLNAC